MSTLAQTSDDVTHWLAQLGTHVPEASTQVYQMLYSQLHQMALGHMRREVPEHTLSATGLVHEAWLRMAQQNRTEWQNRHHFMAVASTMMRRILVDHALARRAAKRDVSLVPLTTTLLEKEDAALDDDVVAVHEALTAFATVDERAAKVVELRFFGGLTIKETAYVLETSETTVRREWTFAKAWFQRELGKT